MSLVSVLIKTSHVVFKEFQVCHKDSMYYSDYQAFHYLPNTIYLIGDSVREAA